MASRGLRSNPNRDWRFHAGDLDSADVAALLDLHLAEMRSGSPPEACHVLAAEGLRGPLVTFWSLRQDERLLGVGALKQIDRHHGEIKSMRTAPDALGRGVGTAMLRHILGEARHRGYRRISLETGSGALFAAALRLYAREGFVPCAPFAGYRDSPFTRFLTCELEPCG